MKSHQTIPLLTLIYLFPAIIATLSCGNELSIDKSDDQIDTVKSGYNRVFSPKAGWDVYDGGGYRYGPSIITDDDGLIQAWFASPGAVHGMDVLLYHADASPRPIAIESSDIVAQHFMATDAFYSINVRCPNWNSTNSALTLRLYSWLGDYATSIATSPIASMHYDNYTDNQYLQLANPGKFASGAYIWTLSEGNGTAGVWSRTEAMPNSTSYFNGESVDEAYEAYLMLEQNSGTVYWDQAMYRTSIDGGKTWTADVPALSPTDGSRDEYSVCDPGVVKIGNYYYAGYTSTEDEGMIFNHVYVARSTTPTGPWLKWDGTGWSDNPQPVVEFDGHQDAWGAGEPSMVINNDTLFFYYTWTDKHLHETRVAIADATDENWPAGLTYKGIAIDKLNIAGSDHCDVKYRPDIKRYQAIHTAARMTASSYIVLWESSDGLRFEKVGEIRQNLKSHLHNCGWSGDLHGHIDPSKPQYISYAYGSDWGNWKTSWHPITF
ncbi:hypothetical protein [Parapedobacter sp. 10938]|uniref:hypothetical protein n=1 Tax=Parapedobacter flavus TaxID=3110225 RepID=UPI002DBC53B7|nr:hypothetical protein [Parapedobacter sp. 10938]MEC3880176.1 hypothetical protein [Parapedobacter sp. 10938]